MLNLVHGLHCQHCFLNAFNIVLSLYLFLSFAPFLLLCGWLAVGGLWINSFDKWEKMWQWVLKIQPIKAGLGGNWLSVCLCVCAYTVGTKFITDRSRHDERPTGHVVWLLSCELAERYITYSQCIPMPCGHCPVIQEGCLIILYSNYFYYGCLLALFSIIASELHISSIHSFYASRHKSPNYKRWDAVHKKHKLLAVSTLFVCNSHFVVQSLAFQGHKNSNMSYCCLWQSVKKEPTKWIGHAEGAETGRQR